MTKKNTTKGALLVSILSLMLCVSMLVGSTFAWFTDSAKTNVNTIQSGTLDIAFMMKEGGAWVTAEGRTLNFVKDANAPQGEEILWEPGATYALPELKLVNAGKLALKFKLLINGVTGDLELADVLDVMISVNGGTAYNAGTLSALMADPDGAAYGTLTAGNETAVYTIALHMQEDAGNNYQGLKLEGMSFTAYATQLASEYDSYGKDYDATADYVAKFTSGTHTVSQDFFASTPNAVALLVEGEGTNVTFVDGFVNGGKGGDNVAVRVNKGATLTIKGGNFTVGGDANGLGNSTIYADGGTINIEGGFFQSEKAYNGKYYVLNIKNSVASSIVVTGGTFVNYNPADGDDTGTDKIVVADGYTVLTETKENGDVYYTVVEVVWEGDASKVPAVEEGVVTLNTAEDLANFAAAVHSGTSYAGKTVKLGADIDLKNGLWTPIGQTADDNFKQFFGTFDGNGHTIYNLRVDMTDVPGTFTSAGLFGWVESNSTIKNLTVDRATVKGNQFVAVIAGYTSGITLDNCHVKNAKVDAVLEKAGAVVGLANPNDIVTNCSAENCEISAAFDAGQVIGCKVNNTGTDSGNTATNVTVSYNGVVLSGDDAGKENTNIRNEIIGRVG